MGACRVLVAITLLCCISVAVSFAQSATTYEALLQQGKSQLQSGNNDAALASANAAIKLDWNRWEAYAVAGGALINLKRCDEAKIDLAQAIKKAPEAKQAGLRDLTGTCVASSSGGSDAGPSYADTLRYIQEKMTDAGYPRNPFKIGHGEHADTTTYDDASYFLQVQGCSSMAITRTFRFHRDYYDDNDQFRHSDGIESFTLNIPLSSIAKIPGQQLPAVFSTHSPTQQGAFGTWLADGFPIGTAVNGQEPTGPNFDVMKEQFASSDKYRYIGLPPDWHDGVWISIGGDGITWRSSSSGGGEDPTENSGQYTGVRAPLLIASFVKPGKGEISTHVAKAIQHLVDLCDSHPDQGPKEPF